ncbi:MAG TPA: bifunctional precorrin-2 dehydrogenase/sirohydrochlorin ferrochelatase [Holophagaceae bacterium]|nr:bifunctional precorrin-2 dehydrogenase/sirohydrochlorin ferrochelatase [Holophagaceae bacterium]
MTLLPLFLDLKDRRVLLVGAGSVARGKLDALAPTGCALRVVALAIPASFRAAAEAMGADLREAPFRTEDLDGVTFVVAATNDPATNLAIAREARARKILVNAVDDVAGCDAFFAATIRRGPLTLAIGSDGQFPGLTRALRRLLEAFLPEGDAPLFHRLARARARCRHLPAPEARKAALDPLLTAFERTYPGVSP